MSQSFLLDTSAFRSLSKEALELVSNYHALYTSPFCFWELLTHLDEYKDFERAKGQFMKFTHIQVLDDPYAAVESPWLLENTELKDRPPDEDLIYATLAPLKASTSLEEFYLARIADSQGRQYEVNGCVARAREDLHKAEDKFTGFIESVLDLMRRGQIQYEASEDRHRAVLSLVEGWIIRLQQQGASGSGMREALTAGTYVYCSYVFHRAIDYFRRNKIKLDRNDYGDVALCLHIALNTPYCVVAGDQDIRSILMETISLLKNTNQPQFVTTLRTIDVAEIRNLSLPTDPAN